VILICAATRLEASACRDGLADVGARAAVLQTGVGPARAAAALGARLHAAPLPSLVVSSGFAGALSPGILLHTVVTATGLHRLGPEGVVPVPLPAGGLRPFAGALPCQFATTDGVWAAVAPGLPAPAAVDMESAALAETAAAAGVPVAVLRVISDTPTAPLPPFAVALGAALVAGPSLAGLRAVGGALAAAARHPVAAVAFARSSFAAARALRAAWRERGA
jgi:hypothetical protein